MKKLNNKGITIIEVLVCFVLVVIIAMSLFSTISAYNDKRMAENYKTRIYSYKNILTKDIQDDFITIGLTHATYKRTVDSTTKKVTHQVDCNLSDGTRRRLIVSQRFTQSASHPDGNPTLDDEFKIQYGNPDREITDYELPDLGSSYVKINDAGKPVSCKTKSDECHEQKDLSINNILIEITNDNVLSIYIGFYHPELSTRYGINIVAPMDFTSKLSDMSSGLDILPPEVDTYTVRFELGEGATGTVNPVTVNSGENVRLPNATSENGIHKDGCSLVGWTVRGEGETNIDYSVDSYQRFNRDTTLYAVWEPAKTRFTYIPGYNQYFEVPTTGYYLIQVWGAAGGAMSDRPTEMGYGGYAEALVSAQKGTILYVNVGGAGKMATTDDAQIEGGKIGGGPALQRNLTTGTVGSGGGATIVSTSTLKDLERVIQNDEYWDHFMIIAGGGGGSYYSNGVIKGKGGSAGGVIGESGQKEGVWSTELNEWWPTNWRFPGCGYGGNVFEYYQPLYAEVPTRYYTSEFPIPGAGAGFGAGFVSGSENTGSGGGSSYLYNGSNRMKIWDSALYCYNCMESDDGEAVHTVLQDLNYDGSSFRIENNSELYNHSSTLSSLENNQLTGEILSSGDGFVMITYKPNVMGG